jgi:hypothetical protein
MSLAMGDGPPIGGDGVTKQKAVVEKYTEGFWTLVGKDAFAAEADSDDGPNPELTLDRLVEEGDTVAVVGHGSVSLGGDPQAFVYSEVFTFTDGLVSRLDTIHIWLGKVPA